MIIENLTVFECGVYLEAIGACMLDGVCAGAILEESRAEIAASPFGTPLFVLYARERGLTEKRAKELLQMDLEEAIEFNPESL